MGRYPLGRRHVKAVNVQKQGISEAQGGENIVTLGDVLVVIWNMNILWVVFGVIALVVITSIYE